jgi:UDP-N-acetylmuramate dehydrogenase
VSGHAEQLEAVGAALGPLARRSAPLAPLCTYRVGGPAALLVTVTSTAELEVVAEALVGTDLPLLVVGNGSNLLVADAGFEGLAVQLGDGFEQIELDGDDARARLGGAVLLPVAARRTAAGSLRGFEWAVGVPGSVGGAVRMNAGGHGSDLAASLVEASILDLRKGTLERWAAADLELGYRRSAVGEGQVVVAAELQLEPGDRSVSEAEISEIVRWRRANQPGGQNAGSVFTNPPGDSAGRLIDAAGLKGLRVGSAEVSTKHANFIQADAGGSADDVHRLIGVVRQRVDETFGVVLECENRLVGFGHPTGDTGGEGQASGTGAP